HHVDAQMLDQGKIGIAAAKSGAADGVGVGTIGGKRDLVAHVGDVGLLQNGGDFFAGPQNAVLFHVVCRGSDEGGDAGDGDAAQFVGLAIAAWSVPLAQKPVHG